MFYFHPARFSSLKKAFISGRKLRENWNLDGCSFKNAGRRGGGRLWSHSCVIMWSNRMLYALLWAIVRKLSDLQERQLKNSRPVRFSADCKVGKIAPARTIKFRHVSRIPSAPQISSTIKNNSFVQSVL